MAQREGDPLATFHFMLDVQGKVKGFFTEISGLGSETDIIEQKQVDAKGRDLIVKVPGRQKFTDVTLKRGITDVKDFWDWRQEVIDGKIKTARKNASIFMLDTELNPIAQWDLENAWPSKVTGPQAQSESSNFGMEELTLTYEYMKRVS